MYHTVKGSSSIFIGLGITKGKAGLVHVSVSSILVSITVFKTLDNGISMEKDVLFTIVSHTKGRVYKREKGKGDGLL